MVNLLLTGHNLTISLPNANGWSNDGCQQLHWLIAFIWPPTIIHTHLSALSPKAPNPQPNNANLDPVDISLPDVHNTNTILDTLLEQSMSLLAKQTQQSKSLCNLIKLSEELLEGMNLILCKLKLLDPCPPPQQYALVSPHHPTMMTDKPNCTQTTVLATQIQPIVASLSYNDNVLPQTNAPPGLPPPVQPPKPTQPPKVHPHQLTRIARDWAQAVWALGFVLILRDPIRGNKDGPSTLTKTDSSRTPQFHHDIIHKCDVLFTQWWLSPSTKQSHIIPQGPPHHQELFKRSPVGFLLKSTGIRPRY